MTSGDPQGLWQHVAQLRPSLRKHVRVLVQEYRGERWYLLHDESAGRFTRFNSSAYEVLGRLDGDLTVQEILDLANMGHDEDSRLQQDDILQVIAQLHTAEVLRGGLPVGAREVLERYNKSQRHRRRRALSNPLALRIPLFDPNKLLDRMAPLARALFSWGGLWLWLGVVSLAGLLALANAQEIAAEIGAKTLSTSQVLIFWSLYPVIKALHELGHGLAVKAWGGEVHETGINLLVFMPVPYVDASSAWAFRDKRRRALVGAAGILVELFLAALGILVWLLVEPGLVRELALNVALVGGISTLLFNGNPLLRFDGYYVLEDLVEIPNLASRSARYYLYLIQRHVLGLAEVRSPANARGESAWFAVYGLAAPLYRLTVLVGIALYLAGEFLIVGVVLAVWAVSMQILKPLGMSLRFLFTSERLEARRVRGFVALGAVLCMVGGLLVVPAPLITRAEGVVWLDDKGQVTSGAEGFVTEVVARAGSTVAAGDLLIRLEDGELKARRVILVARLRELRTQRAAEREQSRVKAAIVEDDIEATMAELRQIDERIAALQVRSAVDGRFFPRDPREALGKFVRQGDVLGYVIQAERPIVRAVVDQDRVGLLRSGPVSAEVLLADHMGAPLPATLLREVPAGSTELPSAALGAMGGGSIAIDTRDGTGRTATEKLFQFDLALPEGTRTTGIGGRAYVRLDHGSEPLWRQWSRSLQQLLLSQLKV